MGFTSDGDELEFFRRRVVELKHGRVCMIACIGYIVPEFVKFPGFLSPSMGLKFADVPNGLAALSIVPANGWSQIVAFSGWMELAGARQERADAPGELKNGFDFWTYGAYGLINGPTIADDATKKKKLAAEIANGRLAMMAIMGMMFNDGLTGQAWGDWALYTDSPLRAFENELGVQPPVGFWDPMGFTSDGDELEFFRRRVVEIKHGRVCMIACVGYIVPEFVKFPGFLSPSMGLKFADVPNGLAALTVVPANGWSQIVAFCGWMELAGARQEREDQPGNLRNGFDLWTYGAFGLINGPTIADEAIKKKKLAAEIANGRLAMAAIMGMMFND